jgi:hypothetical protein
MQEEDAWISTNSCTRADAHEPMIDIGLGYVSSSPLRSGRLQYCMAANKFGNLQTPIEIHRARTESYKKNGAITLAILDLLI